MGLDQQGAQDVAVQLFITLWDDAAAVVRPGMTLRESLLEGVREAYSTSDAPGPAAESSRPEEAVPAVASLDDPRLDTEERRALELAVEGSDYRAIADALGQSVDTVRRVLTSALFKLSE